MCAGDCIHLDVCPNTEKEYYCNETCPDYISEFVKINNADNIYLGDLLEAIVNKQKQEANHE